MKCRLAVERGEIYRFREMQNNEDGVNAQFALNLYFDLDSSCCVKFGT